MIDENSIFDDDLFYYIADFQEYTTINEEQYRIKTFSNIRKLLIFYGDEIRDKEDIENLLIIYSGKEFNFDDGRIRPLIRESQQIIFNYEEFFLSILKIKVKDNIARKKKISWFLWYYDFIVMYKISVLKKNNTEILDVSEILLDELEEFIKNFIGFSRQLPLFVVDLTFMEFEKYLDDLESAYTKYPENFNERRRYFKELVILNLGKYIFNENGDTRVISENNKEKFAINYLITFNQMNLIDDYVFFHEIYNLKINNRSLFINKIREVLYEKYNWKIYIDLIERSNGLSPKLRKKFIYHELKKKFHIFKPNRSVSGWERQFVYVKRWLYDKDLNFIGHYIDKNNNGNMTENEKKQVKKTLTENTQEEEGSSFTLDEEDMFNTTTVIIQHKKTDSGKFVENK